MEPIKNLETPSILESLNPDLTDLMSNKLQHKQMVKALAESEKTKDDIERVYRWLRAEIYQEAWQEGYAQAQRDLINPNN